MVSEVWNSSASDELWLPGQAPRGLLKSAKPPPELLVDGFDAELLRIETSADPVLQFVVFLVIRIFQGVQHAVEAREAAAILRRTLALAADARRQAYPRVA